MEFEPSLIETLLRESGDGHSLDLDRFGDIIAPYNFDVAAIDELLAVLEGRGCKVETTEAVRLREELAAVLPAARAFAAKHGRRPNVQELAEASGLDVRVVRRALMFGQVMGR